MNYNYMEKVSSTNTFVKERIAELPDWYVLRAGEQTDGRGRFDRVWHCENGKDIAMSVLIPVSIDVLPNLTAIVGVSVMQVLERYVRADIKWPNDILIRNRKVCGILCEAITFNSTVKVVVGIGLNVNSKREKPAISLSDEARRKFNLDILAKDIVKRIIRNINRNDFKRELNRKLAYRNEIKTVIDGDKRITGTVIGIGENCELLMKGEDGIMKFISGEISFEKT